MMQGWRNILGPSTLFPRDVLCQIPGSRIDADSREWEENGKYKVTVHNLQDYLELIVQNAPKRDMWVGWSQANQYDESRMEWLYGDVDSLDLQESLEMARAYEGECMDLFGVQPAAVFSCGKGFHLHFTHDRVPYRGRAYHDAVQGLLETELDPAPLKHRQAKPRIPYTLNLKASAREFESMYVVPVDLSWDLDEIMERAKNCDAYPFTIPHSTSAADILSERAERIEERLRYARSQPRDTERENLMVQVALRFCRRNGPYMVDRHGRADGRKRLLYALYVPALMHEYGGDENAVLAEAMEFLEDCGASWSRYRPYVLSCIKNSIMDDGTVRRPMSVPRFAMESPGLRWPR